MSPQESQSLNNARMEAILPAALMSKQRSSWPRFDEESGVEEVDAADEFTMNPQLASFCRNNQWDRPPQRMAESWHGAGPPSRRSSIDPARPPISQDRRTSLDMQLQVHIESIRRIFEDVMNVESGAGAVDHRPNLYSPQIVDYSAQQQQTLLTMQQQLLTALLNCQQQLQSQHAEMRQMQGWIQV